VFAYRKICGSALAAGSGTMSIGDRSSWLQDNWMNSQRNSEWWRSAVINEIAPSFQDTNDDGRESKDASAI
jgi:hypothetical protein